MPSSFWNRRNVFVTGHTGFKGSWLCLWLLQAGARVTGFSKDVPTSPSLYALSGLDNACEWIEGDVCDYEALRRALAHSGADTVFHLAAQALVRKSVRSPDETFSSNAMGTANLLEAARSTGFRGALIIVTTDKCYANEDQGRPFLETDPLGGKDPYSASKACAEMIASAYRRCYYAPTAIDLHGTSLATARAGNVIGGGDWAEDRLLVDAIKGLSHNGQFLVRNPAATRPWQHVLDVINGYGSLAENCHRDGCKFSQSWNFGPPPDQAKPVSWVADRICQIWGDGAKWTHAPDNGPAEAAFLSLDASKAKTNLGWKPLLDLETTLDWTVNWYKGVAKGDSAARLCQEQIEQFGQYA